MAKLNDSALEDWTIAEIKRLLAAAGTPEAALYAALSGSGSSLFGLYQTRGDAEAAANRLADIRGVETHITQTIPRSEYWGAMILEAASSF